MNLGTFMPIEAIRPSTLAGIKRLARSLKVERSIRHMPALDAAAQVAGYQNFRHASNTLRQRPGIPLFCTVCPVFSTACRKDRAAGSTGRETLTAHAVLSMGDLMTASPFQSHRALDAFRAEGSDHLALCSSFMPPSFGLRGVTAGPVPAVDLANRTVARPMSCTSRSMTVRIPISAIPTGGANLAASGGTNGCDSLSGIERLKFDDGALAFDPNGNAGQACRLYQAALLPIIQNGITYVVRGECQGRSMRYELNTQQILNKNRQFPA